MNGSDERENEYETNRDYSDMLNCWDGEFNATACGGALHHLCPSSRFAFGLAFASLTCPWTLPSYLNQPQRICFNPCIYNILHNRLLWIMIYI